MAGCQPCLRASSPTASKDTAKEAIPQEFPQIREQRCSQRRIGRERQQSTENHRSLPRNVRLNLCVFRGLAGRRNFGRHDPSRSSPVAGFSDTILFAIRVCGAMVKALCVETFPSLPKNRAASVSTRRLRPKRTFQRSQRTRPSFRAGCFPPRPHALKCASGLSLSERPFPCRERSIPVQSRRVEKQRERPLQRKQDAGSMWLGQGERESRGRTRHLNCYQGTVVEGCRVGGRMLPVQSRRDEPGILHRVFDIKRTEFDRCAHATPDLDKGRV